MPEPRGAELIARYKANYGIAEDANITEEQILQHWELEKRLRQRLLNSTPETRFEVFERAYTELYSELEWLNELVDTAAHDETVSYELWLNLVGEPPQRIYEVGSGRGELISYLAQHGFECRASEITQYRGEQWATEHENLTWNNTDGVHLEQFEPTEHYDVVISNQVIEHMHPDDLPAHMRSVLELLKPGGRYIFSTPHGHSGPTDVCTVFGTDTLEGMHLKEYTYRELKQLAEESGFARVSSVLRLPRKVRKMFGLKPQISWPYLTYLILVERAIGLLPDRRSRRKATRLAKTMLFTGNIIMIAEKAR